MNSIKKILKYSKKHFENKNEISAVELKNLLIDFGGLTAVNNVNIKINQGELVTLLGPSGCGKTTMLNAIAGLLTPTSGKIIFKGKDVTKFSPQKRKIGLVFQNYALYPHMNVYKNIAFPLQHDKDWQETINKKNEIAKLKISKIILKSNGASPSELQKLEKYFFTIYDVKRELDLYLNKSISKGKEEFNNLQAKLNLAKPNYISEKRKINSWGLKELSKIKTTSQKSNLKQKIKEKLSKAKKEFITTKTHFSIELKKAKQDLKDSKFNQNIANIQKSNKKAINVAESNFKNLLNKLKNKYGLDKNKLASNQQKQIAKEQEKIITLKDAIHNEIMNVAKKVDIVKNLQKFPTKLSGGQQQRVAIARGIVKNPDILLMDEPLSNLDAKLRIQTRNWIRKIQQELKITLIFVTHDQEEAMAISDRIICLNNGDVQQSGAPLDLYTKPKNEFVAKFLGMPEMKLVKAETTKNGAVKLLGKTIAKVDPKYNSINIGLRSDDFKEKTKNGMIQGYIDEIEYLGKEIRTLMVLDVFGKTFVSLNKKTSYQIGEKIILDIKLENINLFNSKTGERIDV